MTGRSRAAGRRRAGRSIPTGKNTVLPESLRSVGPTFHYGKNDLVLTSKSEMLTVSDAVGIYKMQTGFHSEFHDSESRSLWEKTRPVAKLFGTNVRTVKYIWNRKTWSHATKHLWPTEAQFKSSAVERKVNIFCFELFLTNLI